MLNNNGGAFHQSPAGTSAEREVVRAFAELLGLGAAWGGMFLPGGTYANLQGLLLARARHFPDWERAGPGAVPARPTLYAASSSHFSVARSAQVIGIGGDDVEAVPVVGRGGLDVEALAARVAADRESGRTPFCVVATIGTTGTGAIDDIDRIADVCAEHGLWLHVDACYGGAIALCDELRDRLRGIERGDSVVVDSHKWFFMPITAGLLLTPHRDVEAACFRVDAPYIPGDGEIDAFRRGIPTSRRGQGLAVWLTLRAHGFAPIRAAVRRNIAQMRSLERRLAASGFRVLPGGELSICCARYEPDGRSPGELDALQVRIAEDVVARGIAWFATTRHAGLTWLRFNTVNLHTRDRHVEQIADAVIASASRLTEPRMHSP
jgi:aromatic-L-amino-acid decarboxylase